MTTKEVADQLIQLCRNGQVEEAKLVFFTEETRSIEPVEGLLPKEVKGLAAIQQKARLFIEQVEAFYDMTITEPIIAGDYFTVGWTTDLQLKGQERHSSSQLCLYQVSKGKIILEQFFY